MALITADTADQIKQGNIRFAAGRIVDQMTRQNDGQTPDGATRDDAIDAVAAWYEAEAARKSAARLSRLADKRLGDTLGTGWGAQIVSATIEMNHR